MPPDNGIDLAAAGQTLGMLNGVDDTPVGTTGNDDQAFGRFDEQGLIILEWIGPETAICSDKGTGVNRFKICNHRHFTAGNDIFTQPHGFIC